MAALIQDVRYGIRQLLKTPVVTFVAVMSVALGIGASATSFSLVNSFLFEPLPFGDPATLMAVREGDLEADPEQMGAPTMASFRDYEAGVTALSGMAAWDVVPQNLTGVDQPEQLSVVVATPNIFEVIQASPALGRGFLEDEGVEGRGQVAVLEYDFWQARYQGDPDILGQSITLDGEAVTVIGIMPADFDMLPANVHLFRPSSFQDVDMAYDGRGYSVMARLAPGATVERANQEALSVFGGLQDRYPEELRGQTVRIMDAAESILGRSDRILVIIMALVTILGLIIASANVANLLLARAEERQKEVALRTALGAAPARIFRQLITESAVMGAAAGVIGIGLSLFGISWLRGQMPVVIPASMLPDLDLPVLSISLALSLLCGLGFGLFPALNAMKGDLRESLGEGSRGGTASRARRRLRSFFVVGEVAVALALLTGSGFLIEAFRQLFVVEPGYEQEGLATFFLAAPEYRYPGPDELRVYQDELIASLEGVPGVRGVAAMTRLPRGQNGLPYRQFEIPGRVLPDDADPPVTIYQAVNPDFLATMGLDLVQGRDIGFGDREDSQPVMLVSRSFVRREFRGDDPLGQQVQISGEDEPRTVVGVVEDAVFQRIVSGDVPQAYVPLAQNPIRAMNFALRFDGDPMAAAADIRRAVWAVNPDQPLDALRTLDDYVAESLAGPRAVGTFMGVMGALALLLASMGIYGVMAHSVLQQHREIGIRLALGAGKNRVIRMVTGSGLRLVGTGMLIGIPIAFLMYRAVLQSLGPINTTAGLRTALVVSGVLLAVSMASVLLPALRATSVAPAAALREE